MRSEKQGKKYQNGLNKSLGISICDSLAISIVTLHYFLLLSCLRPIEMRAAHLRQFVEITSSLWVMLMISDRGWSAVRWMADNSIHLHGELLSDHFHGFWIYLITSYSLSYLPSSLFCKISYFIFKMQRWRNEGVIDLSKVTQACPGFPDWFRQRPNLHFWNCRQILWVLGP